MSRVSTLVIGSLAAAAFVLSAGCTAQVSATVKTKQRFVENNVRVDATEDWNGEPIVIDVAGVGVAVNGGLNIHTDPAAVRLAATARLLAMADAEDKASADQSIIDTKATYQIVKDGGTWKITCGHGGSHGTSNSGESGCEFVDISLPVGAADKPLVVTALSGNGSVDINVANATLGELGVNGKGDIEAWIPTTKGARVSIVAEQADDITAHLPNDFSADEVIVQADADKITNGFADLTLDANGTGTRGTAGEGASSLKFTSKEFAGSTGNITLTPN